MFELAFINPLGQLVVSTADSTQQRALTKPGIRYQLPTWSPDGAHLLAIGSHDRDQQTMHGLYVIDVSDAPVITPIYEDETCRPLYANWSPDGQAIAFITQQDEQVGLHIHTRNAESEQREMHQPIALDQAFYWDWMRDSQEILLHRGVGQDGVITVKNIVTDEALPPLGVPGLFQMPGVSLSGRYITYDIIADDKPHLVFADLAADEKRDNTHTVAHPGPVAMQWSPCNDEIAFIAGKKEVPYFYGQLFLLTPGGRLQPLTKRPAMAIYWAKNGHTLAYLTPRITPKLTAGQRNVIDILTDLPARLQQNHQIVPELELEVWLVDFAYGITEKQIGAFRPTPLFLTDHLPIFDQIARTHPVWARDSRSLIFPAMGDGGSELIQFFVEGDQALLGRGHDAAWRW